MIFLNLKTYPEGSGDHAVKLALACELAIDETHIPIVPIVAPLDLWRVSQHTGIPIWIQHVDPHPPGATTGYTTIESALAAGAHGTLLNHSEHSLPFDILETTVRRIRQIDRDFKIMICAPDLSTLERVCSLNPDFVAYEPPELIANPTKSVATEQAQTIGDAVKRSASIPLIVGAGIKDISDVTVSVNQGAYGVLIASAVVKTPDPRGLLVNLARAFNKS